MGLRMWCVFVLVVALGSCQAVDICDLCKCTKQQGNVKSVTCDCNSPDKFLNLTDDKLSNVAHMTDFAVSNCSGVEFVRGAFRLSTDLERVTVSRVRSVAFSVGVFSALSSLHIEDVNELQLPKKGFLGAALKEITIHRSKIKVLPSMVLRDVAELSSFELKGVEVGQIEASAIKFDMEDNSQFIIDGCKIGKIERGGVNVKTSRLLINSTTFDDMQDQAVAISASQSTDVIKSVFSTNVDKGLAIESGIINIELNTFSVLPIGLLKRPTEGSNTINFRKNIIFLFRLMNYGIDLSTVMDLEDFKDNEVHCDCELAKSVLSYKASQPKNAPRLKENYCYLLDNPHCKVSLQQISDDQERMCEGEDSSAELVELCNGMEPFSDHVPARDGRAEDHPIDTTIAEYPTIIPTTITVKPEGAQHHISSSPRAFNVGVLLTSLAVILHFFVC